MDISLFLAQAFGIYFTVAGVAMLLHPHIIKRIIGRFSTDRSALFISGLFALFVGIPLVLLHNIWDGTWQIVITILVWIVFLKGVLLLLAPDLMAGWSLVFVSKNSVVRFLFMLWVVLGLYLMYVGFGLG